MNKNKKILVISGGGLKGFSALGAVKYLCDENIIDRPENYAGSSAGAFICFLLNIGYTPIEIHNTLMEIDFSTIVQYAEFDDGPEFGISEITNIMQVIHNFMKNKNINKKITFKQLFELTHSKLFIVGSCLNDSCATYFSVDSSPNMPIIKALQISSSIPFLFKPCKWKKKLWVDGGCINNYPIELFNDKLDDVIGIYLDDNYEYIEITDIQDYFYSVFKCLYRGLNYEKLNLFKKYTIHTINNPNHSTNWNIDKIEKQNMFDIGFNSAKSFNSQHLRVETR